MANLFACNCLVLISLYCCRREKETPGGAGGSLFLFYNKELNTRQLQATQEISHATCVKFLVVVVELSVL